MGEDFTGDKIDQQSRGNYDNRVYASANPSIDVEGVSTQTPSFIFYIKWDPSILLLLPDDSEVANFSNLFLLSDEIHLYSAFLILPQTRQLVHWWLIKRLTDYFLLMPILKILS